MNFKLASDYQPCGDQPQAIAQLVRGIEGGEKHQVLLGVTGSGKTFTAAKIIEAVNLPTIVLAHNKTLAAQLFHEFRGFFPQNAVEYFVSYYDYYQPEAYIPASDTYIEKESTINDELDRLRMSATRSLFERRDVIIVASVSCIYGLGSPEAYYGMLVMIEPGQRTAREACCGGSWIFSTSAARICGAALSACAATRSRFIRRTRITPSASRCGATRSRRLRAIDSLTGEVRGEPLVAPADLSQDRTT